MIDKASRPTPIDFDAPIADWRVRDIVSVINAHIAETSKEVVKVEKEGFKPEKEGSKPEGGKPGPGPEVSPQVIDRIAVRVVELMEERGMGR